MSKEFSKERRDLLKTTGTLVAATAVVSVGSSLKAFAVPGEAQGIPVTGDNFVFADGPKKGQVVSLTDVVVDAAPLTVQAKDASGAVRDSDNSIVLLYRVSHDKISADMKDDTVEGVMAYSAVCTHLGCILSNWDVEKKQFLCPCHDALFDPLNSGANTGGATSRTLPRIPLKAVDGKLVVADKPTGYVGVKRG